MQGCFHLERKVGGAREPGGLSRLPRQELVADTVIPWRFVLQPRFVRVVSGAAPGCAVVVQSVELGFGVHRGPRSAVGR